MILLWGLRRDGPLAAVASALAKSVADVVFLDQARTAEFSLNLSAGTEVHGTIHVADRQIPFEEVQSIYLRPYDFRRVPAIARAGEGSDLWRHVEQFDDALLTWTEITDTLVVNRPSSMASNNSKPYQSMMIDAAGFRTPLTVLTNDIEVLRDFASRNPRVIYKSTSGTRSIVGELDILDVCRLSNLKWCPTQFQAYVPGVDYRVHVVNQETFVCRVTSPAIDYRYGANKGMSPVLTSAKLPDDVIDRCVRLARSLDLVVAGIDLRESEGDIYCFEVNPSPGFTFFEDATGQPIAAAVADLLASSLIFRR
jgi:glutathione synthase/RimK-type ligase-like ATP-grasp enzyme